MPGQVSDSYDPEFGTSANVEEIKVALLDMHANLGVVIGSDPKFILEVVFGEDGKTKAASFTEKQWRILRFACERASESL